MVIAFLLLVNVMTSSYAASGDMVSRGTSLSECRCTSVVGGSACRVPTRLVRCRVRLFSTVRDSHLGLIGSEHVNRLSPGRRSGLLVMGCKMSVLRRRSIMAMGFVSCLANHPVTSYHNTCAALKFDMSTSVENTVGHITGRVTRAFPGWFVSCDRFVVVGRLGGRVSISGCGVED